MGSIEVIDNFQFVTRKIEFDELGKVTRIAYYYSKGVKAGINLALKGVSLKRVLLRIIC